MKKVDVICEGGINHNGDFDTLLKLADMSMEAGGDYFKIQLRTPRTCVPQEQWNKPRQWFDGEWITYIDYKDRMELTYDQLLRFDRYMREKWGESKWSASVWDHPSLERLLKFDVPFIKIPSASLTNHSLIRSASATGIPLIISTGMSTPVEIKEAIEAVPDNYPLTIMACNSSYPTIDEEVNLRSIRTLRELYLPVPINYTQCITRKNNNSIRIGFSSHSKSPYPVIYSTLLGAETVEVHVTLDRTMQGTDHAASLERAGLELVCREIRRIPVLVGDGRLRVYPSEEPARKKLRG